ncbi:MAG TPA: outer membrane beta-barrel protein [Methylomirabilota bacterium]|nr:outer membrane beta-barrel protein [Methylomirabilota bacterium]
MKRSLVLLLLAAGLAAVVPAPALAQKSVAEVLGRPATPEGQPKTYLEELTLFSYIENSFVWNMGKVGRGDVNELRFYDRDNGYTFNAAEFSVRKDPSERYRLGYGVVISAGLDSQKNHSLGIFRSLDDQAPYRNTPKYDLPEAYASYLVPLGNGLTLKGGKWGTPIGYEVYESPKNLNFSRSLLYTLGTPITHTGLLATYPFASWFSMSLGFTNGWDNSDNNNGYLRPMGVVDFTPIDKLTASVHWMVGPEQNRNQMQGGINNRFIVDTTIQYTGIDKLTLAVNFDFAGEENDPTLVALGTRKDNDSRWSGIAGYVAYDWTKALRTVLRLEYFAAPQGVKAGTIAPGHNLDLWEITATIEYKIWRGLVGRLEYRHDEASRRAFSLQNHGTTPTSHAQNTLSVALYYSFF